MNREKVISHAEDYVASGKLDKAIKEFTKILEEDPKDMRVKLRVADLLNKKGEFQPAVTAYCEVAEAYIASRFYLKAIAVFKTILKLNPTLVDINEKLGEAYQQVGMKKDAVNQFIIVAGTYDQRGESQKAVEIRRKILHLDPDNTMSRIRLAELYQGGGKTEQSISEYVKTADILKKKNDFESLIEVYEKMLFFKPHDVTTLEALLGIYFERKDFEKVVQRVEAAPKDCQESMKVLGFWAESLLALKKMSASRQKFKEYYEACAKAGQGDRMKHVYEIIAKEFWDDEEYLAEIQKMGLPSAHNATEKTTVEKIDD